MPRRIDHTQRQLDIIREANNLIAESGLAAVSFREIGRRLGGSTTLVTHYYATRAELLADVASAAVESWRTELDELQQRYPDPADLLNVFLFDWLLPLTPGELDYERYRITFVAAQIQGDENTQAILDVWESGIRTLLRRCLSALVPAGSVESHADVLRATLNGLVLSTIEHPDYWDAERQVDVLQTVARGIGLPVRAGQIA